MSFSLATEENKEAWTKAVKKDMDSLYKNETKTLGSRENASNILTARWICCCKELLHKNGTLYEKFKELLVTRGFQQVHGIDNDETFAPVEKFFTLRMILAIVAEEDLELHQTVVKTAFLNGHLNGDIYMKQLEEYVDFEILNHVCKLQKAL